MSTIEKKCKLCHFQARKGLEMMIHGTNKHAEVKYTVCGDNVGSESS